ncbi:MAG: LLM class flavin-dependent oxidoreductase [Candidatus Dormibacteria bacterium]
MKLALGVAAGPDPSVLEAVAPAAEALGYAALFCNDSPAGDGLLQLASWSPLTHSIELGVGVLAADRHQPDAIAARIQELQLPRERLLLGVGAGLGPQPLQRMRSVVSDLRRALPGVRILVAAMGPQMCRLAGELADGALVNWMTPERAAWARERVSEGSVGAGRSPDTVPMIGYIRCAVGEDASERLERESEFYLQLPYYRKHFEAQGVSPATVGIAAATGAEAAEALSRYDALDVAVVRVLGPRTAEDVLSVGRAVALERGSAG